MPDYSYLIDIIGKIIDFIGVFVIVGGATFSILNFAVALFSEDSKDAYYVFRGNLGKTILLGLEFLIAGDIIRSIAVPPSLQSVTVLGVIVIIRAFLSIELGHEIGDRWPWQRTKKDK